MIILDGVPFDRVSGIEPDARPGRRARADPALAGPPEPAGPRAAPARAPARSPASCWTPCRAAAACTRSPATPASSGTSAGPGTRSRSGGGSAGYRHINAAKCYQGGQPTTCKINGLITAAVTAGTALSLYAHLTDGDPAPLEARLITLLRPPWNGQIPFSPPDWLDEL